MITKLMWACFSNLGYIPLKRSAMDFELVLLISNLFGQSGTGSQISPFVELRSHLFQYRSCATLHIIETISNV